MARQVCHEDDKTSSGGYCYNPSIQTQIQGFVSDPEMFNLTTGMEMIGFSKHLQHQQQHHHSTSDTNMWKTNFIGKLPSQHSASSSKTMNDSNFYHQDFTEPTSSDHHQNLNNMVHHQWQQQQEQHVDDSSLRCVFPCEGNERPSQGLSLSLSSTNPTSIGLQSFELRHTPTTTTTTTQQDQGYHGHFLLKNSKFLLPAQQLLNEFCSLETTKQNDLVLQKQKSQKFNNNKQTWEDQDINNGGSSSSSIKQSLTSLEFVELQKRKTKLLSMLEEVLSLLFFFLNCNNFIKPGYYPYYIYIYIYIYIYMFQNLIFCFLTFINQDYALIWFKSKSSKVLNFSLEWLMRLVSLDFFFFFMILILELIKQLVRVLS
jgi:hypothetical protein